MKANKDKSDGIVYSSKYGRMCPDCGKPVDQCNCRNKPSTSTGDGIVRVSRETKGRKGKGVTVITGVPLDNKAMVKLGKQLKIKCGAGGTVKNGTIEIQGEHRDKVIEALQQYGWTIKRSGG
jgi:translation initiation factor 1